MSEQQKELLELFLRTDALLQRYHGFQSHQRGNPMRGQGRVLSILKLQPTISQKELGYLLDMRNQSLGELLCKLEQKGFITRTPSEEDRRTTVITLTDAGRAVAEQMGEGHSGGEKLFDCLTEEEQRTLADYLTRLSAALEQEFGAFTGRDFRTPPHFGEHGGPQGFDPRRFGKWPGGPCGHGPMHEGHGSRGACGFAWEGFPGRGPDGDDPEDA